MSVAQHAGWGWSDSFPGFGVSVQLLVHRVRVRISFRFSAMAGQVQNPKAWLKVNVYIFHD